MSSDEGGEVDNGGIRLIQGREAGVVVDLTSGVGEKDLGEGSGRGVGGELGGNMELGG